MEYVTFCAAETSSVNFSPAAVANKNDGAGTARFTPQIVPDIA